MRLNILIGGKAGQGINKVSEIVSQILINRGYFIFNYRDYQSLIRGGHNFNVLSISDRKIQSHESRIDILAYLDEKTLSFHKNKLKKEHFLIGFEKFSDFGMNLNIAMAGALIKMLGIEKEILLQKIKEEFNTKETINAAEKGYNSVEKKFDLKKLNNKIEIMTGSKGVAQGAINSGLNIYFSYPMTPATAVMNELAEEQIKNNLVIFQTENEISAVNMALGASFSGAKTMTGTSGGGFDLMTEGLSLQGITEIPLVVYLASRPGPATGVPTYTSQADLNVALYGGHGEFPRIVLAPGDPLEAIEKTNEAFYLSQKFNALSILISDKHLAESEFSSNEKPKKTIAVEIKRKLPGDAIVKASSYEHDEFGNTKENAETTKKNVEERIAKYEEIKKEAKKFEMIKIHGNKNSKNLIISWGSTKGAILDAIQDLDFKFLQVLYIKPMSDEIRSEIQNAKKTILIENNSIGQLGRLIREKTGIKIEKRILKYDGLPFTSDEIKNELEKIK